MSGLRLWEIMTVLQEDDSGISKENEESFGANSRESWQHHLQQSPKWREAKMSVLKIWCVLLDSRSCFINGEMHLAKGKVLPGVESGAREKPTFLISPKMKVAENEFQSFR